MNCFIWILLLLGCGGNCGNRSNCNRYNCNRCNCNRCDDVCDNMIQPRMNDDCGCKHQHHHHDNDCMTPPPVPRFVNQEDDCGCNN
ncbi:MAG: hypothetical protein J6C63_05945 [Lachnospiraceae bacterium]|nr:hypothetical protein [Lachnospiraceae bacterium]